MAFRGSSDQILFFASPNRYLPHPYDGMMRGVSFFVDRNRGLVVQEHYPFLQGKLSLYSGGRSKLVDPSVKNIRFQYLVPPMGKNAERRWVESWDPFELIDQSVTQSQKGRRIQRGRSIPPRPENRLLPLAIQAMVTVQTSREEKEYQFMFPIHVGRDMS